MQVKHSNTVLELFIYVIWTDKHAQTCFAFLCAGFYIGQSNIFRLILDHQ